jgi:hypothetical protein
MGGGLDRFCYPVALGYMLQSGTHSCVVKVGDVSWCGYVLRNLTFEEIVDTGLVIHLQLLWWLHCWCLLNCDVFLMRMPHVLVPAFYWWFARQCLYLSCLSLILCLEVAHS